MKKPTHRQNAEMTAAAIIRLMTNPSFGKKRTSAIVEPRIAAKKMVSSI
jgi:hypothetical protein